MAGVVLVILAVSYLQLSQRSQVDHYLTSAKVVQGLQAAAMVRTQVEEYFWSQGDMPGDNGTLGLPAPETVAPEPVRAVTVLRGGVIHIEFDASLGAGSALTLFPAIARGSGRIDWACSVQGIDPSHLNVLRPPCVRTPQSPISAMMLAIHRADVESVQRLLAQGLDVNQHFQGDRPLPAAVDRGRVDIARLLVKAGANPNQSASYYHGQTPLMIAATHLNVPMIRLLLEHGARVDRRDRQGRTAVDYAARLGTQYEAYRVLALASDKKTALAALLEPSDRTQAPESALMAAVLSGEADKVTAQLAVEAPDREDRRGETALFHALRGSHRTIVDQLLNAGAEVNHRNLRGETPLMIASEVGDVALVARLIEAGAEVDPEPQDGDSPLMRAILKQRYAVAERLLLAGADPKRNAHGALIALVSAPLAPPAALLEKLLARGADSNASDRSGVSALVVAMRLGHIEAAKSLLAHGARAGGDAKGSALPIVMAAERGDTELVRSLLEAGADASSPDREGRTALHAAVDQRSFGTVKLLLQAGADPHREDVQGISPRKIAAAKYYQHILNLIDAPVRR